jgi:hypothetical protein
MKNNVSQSILEAQCRESRMGGLYPHADLYNNANGTLVIASPQPRNRTF